MTTGLATPRRTTKTAGRKKPDAAGYIHHRQSAGQRQRVQALAGQDAGHPPPVIYPEERERSGEDYQFFCEFFFPQAFYLPWSADHLRIIKRMETAVLKGGLFAFAMPRGNGKTTLARAAALWAILIGKRRYVDIIAATEPLSVKLLNGIKGELRNNDRLHGGWPEVTHFIRALEGQPTRCRGQHVDGEPTHMKWEAGFIVLPWYTPAKYENLAKGSVLQTAPLTGSLRGQQHTCPDGTILRPSFVLLDDPQTRDSARSPTQTQTRFELVHGDVLGMAGPKEKMSVVMPCTKVAPDDLAERLLDRRRSPAWRGECTKMVYSFPTNEDLWAEYERIRAAELADGGDGSAATQFYADNREAMDAGAEVAWPERFFPDELSAVQHAMNRMFDDEPSFFAEYQNEPPVEQLGETMLTVDEIAAKQNGLPPNEFPTPVQYLTAFGDIHDRLLYWMVCGWTAEFTGYVLDYGTFPDQKRVYFTMRQATRTLGNLYGTHDTDQAIHMGLEALLKRLTAREWTRADGAIMRAERILVDIGYKPEIVKQVLLILGNAAVKPSRGRSITATRKPYTEYERKAGEKYGLHWRIPNVRKTRDQQHVEIDVNWWKSFVHGRLAVGLGGKGCLSLYKSKQHRLLAEHLTAEFPVRVHAEGRTVDEWYERPAGPDNHWLDCLVGCAVGASILGAKPPVLKAKAKPREKVRLSELQQKKR